MKSFDERQADWAKKEEERTVKVGEARGRTTGDVKTTDDVRVRIDKVETLRFKPSVDLKRGDSIRIIVEKV